MKRDGKRFENLDVLRGSLAILVMIYHLCIWESLNCPKVLMVAGPYSVCSFFLLSGLSLSFVYDGRFFNSRQIIKYAISRCFRIYPLLWIVITTVLLIIYSNGDHVGWKIISINYLGIFSFVKPECYINCGAWSVGNEIVFYTIFPLAIFIFRSSAWAGFFLLFSSVVGKFIFLYLANEMDFSRDIPWNLYVNPLNNLHFFILGMFIYFNKDYFRSIKRPCFSLLFSIFLFFISQVVFNFPIYINIFIVDSLLAVIVSSIFILKEPSKINILYVVGFQSGLVSYGIYLIHPLSYNFVKWFLFILDFDGPFAAISLSVFLTFIASFVIYKYIEAPIISLGKYLSFKFYSAT
jgi:peptidoglycan/LPS O-acetylase OafA/YrhL